MSDLIASYADAVRKSLSFDRRSADRLATEVEDHLHEALACNASGPSDAAARLAIRRFGSPADLAAVYTAQIFPERLKATWRFGLMLGALVLLTMWLRRALDLLPWIDNLPSAEALLATDAIAFRVAFAVGIGAWLVALSGQTARNISLIVLALVAAAGALGLSVAASFVVASAAVVTTGWSAPSLIAMGSTISTCVLMGFLIARIRILRGYAMLMTRVMTADVAQGI
jgi:hypothetical protein